MTDEQPKKPKQGHGKGSVHQRKDGRWVAAITIGRTTEGKQHRKYFYAKTKREAEKLLRQAIVSLEKGATLGDDSITLGQFLDRWLSDTVKPTRSLSTYRVYHSMIEHHLKPGLGNHKLTKLTPTHVRQFINAKKDAGASVAHVRYMRVVLVAALNQALADELVVRNVASLVKPPKAEPFTGSPLTLDEAMRFLEIITGDRMEALYSVALALGLRIGEARGLRWQDVDLDGQLLHVRNQVDLIDGTYTFGVLKTEKSRRTLPIPNEILSSLKAHRQRQLEDRLLAGPRWVPLDLVFPSTIGTPFDRRAIGRSYKALLTKAKIEPRRFHDLRHSCGSLLFAKGVPEKVIQEILGHSRINTTSEIYVHVNPASLKSATDLMGDLFTAQNSAS